MYNYFLEKVKQEPFALLSFLVAVIALFPLYFDYFRKNIDPHIRCLYQRESEDKYALPLINKENIVILRDKTNKKDTNMFFTYANLKCTFSNTLSRNISINEISYRIRGKLDSKEKIDTPKSFYSEFSDTSVSAQLRKQTNFGDLPRVINSNESEIFLLRVPITYWHYQNKYKYCFDEIKESYFSSRILNCASGLIYNSGTTITDSIGREDVIEDDYNLVFTLDIVFDGHKGEKYYAQHKYMLKLSGKGSFREGSAIVP